MRKPTPHTCSRCGTQYKSPEPRSKFCSRSCSAAHGNTGRATSPEAKRKCSESLKRYWKTQPGRKAQIKSIGTNSHRGRRHPKNIFNMSHRTREKVLRRLGISCSYCGWTSEIGDLHHIEGRKGADPHNHEKLSYLCPNDHRLADRGKIDPSALTTFEEQVGGRWRDAYYG